MKCWNEFILGAINMSKIAAGEEEEALQLLVVESGGCSHKHRKLESIRLLPTSEQLTGLLEW